MYSQCKQQNSNAAIGYIISGYCHVTIQMQTWILSCNCICEIMQLGDLWRILQSRPGHRVSKVSWEHRYMRGGMDWKRPLHPVWICVSVTWWIQPVYFPLRCIKVSFQLWHFILLLWGVQIPVVGVATNLFFLLSDMVKNFSSGWPAQTCVVSNISKSLNRDFPSSTSGIDWRPGDLGTLWPFTWGCQPFGLLTTPRVSRSSLRTAGIAWSLAILMDPLDWWAFHC